MIACARTVVGLLLQGVINNFWKIELLTLSWLDFQQSSWKLKDHERFYHFSVCSHLVFLVFLSYIKDLDLNTLATFESIHCELSAKVQLSIKEM